MPRFQGIPLGETTAEPFGAPAPRPRFGGIPLETTQDQPITPEVKTAPAEPPSITSSISPSNPVAKIIEAPAPQPEPIRRPSDEPLGASSFDIAPALTREPGAQSSPAASAGSSFVRGAASTVTSMPRAMAIEQSATALESLMAFDRIDRGEPPPIRGEVGQVALSSVEAYKRASPERRAQMREQLAGTLDPRQSSLYQAGERAQQAVEGAFPVDPAYQGDFALDQVPQGLGSTLGFLGTGIVGRAARLPAAPTMAGAGYLASEAGQFDDAMQHGASIETAVRAGQVGGLAGTSEALPVARLLDRLDRGTGGSIRRLLVETLKQGTEEAIQEFGQQVAQNAIAQGMYDPERDLFEGAAENAGVGFTVGSIMQFTLGLLTHRRGAAPQPQPQPTARQEPYLGDQPPAAPAGQPTPVSPPDGGQLADTGVPEGAMQAETVIGTTPQVSAEILPPAGGPNVAQMDPGTQEPPQPVPPRSREALRSDLADPRPLEEIQAEQQAAQESQQLEVQQQAEAAAEAERKAVGDGAPDAPIKVETTDDVSRGAERTAEPTPAQAEAGNYSKRHVKWQGLDISIETEQGQNRSGVGADGKPWSVAMPAPYGYIRRTEGSDGDHVDIYMGSEPQSESVFVVDQIDPATGKFDEHKVFLGFPSAGAVTQAYHQAFSDGSAGTRAGHISRMTVDEFKTWLRKGDTKKPLAYEQPKTSRQRKRQAYTPAVKIGDKIYRGASHSDALDRAAKDHNISPEEFIDQIEGKENVGLDGFINDDGEFLSRAEAYARENGAITTAPARTRASAATEAPPAGVEGQPAAAGPDPALMESVRKAIGDIKGALEPQRIAKMTGKPVDDVKRTLAYMAGQGLGIRQNKKTGKFTRIPKTPPLSALEFIASKGGIRDDEGHNLRKGRNAQRSFPRYGALIRNQGMSVDYAGEALHEAGYFGTPDSTARPTTAQVLELIERELGGKKTYSEADRDRLQQRDDGQAEQAHKDEAKAVREEIQAISDDNTYGLTAAEVEAAFELVANDGMSPAEAVVEVMERGAIADYAEAQEILGDDDAGQAIPFGEEPTQVGPEERSAPAREASAPPPARDADGKAEPEGRGEDDEVAESEDGLDENDESTVTHYAKQLGVSGTSREELIAGLRKIGAVSGQRGIIHMPFEREQVSEALRQTSEDPQRDFAALRAALKAHPEVLEPAWSDPVGRWFWKHDGVTLDFGAYGRGVLIVGGGIGSQGWSASGFSEKNRRDVIRRMLKDPRLGAAAAKEKDQGHTDGDVRERTDITESPPRPPQQSRETATASGQKIEDFGETLHGARKHYAAAYQDRMKEAAEVNIVAEPLSKSWPEPDYQKLIDDGADTWTVAFIRAARDEIPTKPQKSWKLQTWADQVKMLRGFAQGLLDGTTSKERLQEALAERQFESLRRTVGGRADLYAAVGHDKSLKGVRLTSGSYSVFAGQRFDKPKVIWSVEREAKATAFGNWPRQFSIGDTRDEAIANFKKAMDGGENPQPEAEKQVSFTIYTRRSGPTKGKWIIGKKIGADYIDLQQFDDTKTARAYLAEHRDELEKQLARFKDVPRERKESNAPRLGTDHRNGADVTPGMFSEAFGFRGVQFGNYVESDRRQQDLNDAYDALMDMAGVLGIPAKAISLNGELGLAFGARGKGGKNPASAHYEPDNVVINLTKGKGAGSLAHEWWHALDNYFSRARDQKTGYVSEAAYERGAGVRPAMVKAFADVMQAIRQTSLQQRSRELDKRRTNAYWSTSREMSARAFESYIVAKLEDQSASNDYLANIVSEDYWNAQEALRGFESGKETYPYPTAAEVPAVRSVFERFFQTVESQETERGVQLFARREQPATTEARSPDAVFKELRAELDRLGLKRVRLETPAQIAGGKAEGMFWRRAIWVALDSNNTTKTLHHEIIHALNGLGLIEPAEWRALEQMAREKWIEQYEIRRRYADDNLTSEQITEEAVAEAFKNYMADTYQPKGMVGRAFAALRRVLDAIKRAFGKAGYTSWDQVFEAAAEGDIGRRSQDGRVRFEPQLTPAFARLTEMTDQGENFTLGFEKETPDQVAARKRKEQKDEAEAMMAGKKKPTTGQEKADDLPLFGGDRQRPLFSLRDPDEKAVEPKIKRAPATTDERKSVMLQMLGDKQPIDRLLRVPFQIFGGLDRHGHWKPGVHLYDKASNIITSAQFTPHGRFAFLNPILENARRNLVDRYGLDPDYVRRDRERDLDERAIAKQGLKFLTDMQQAGMRPEEARLLQAVLTGEQVASAEWEKVAMPIRQAIDELGAEAVELGLVSKESYERNRGTYLHRVYMKDQGDAPGLVRWVGQAMNRRRKKIIGDELKGRGIFLDVPIDALHKADPEFKAAAAGKAVRGQKFLVMDRSEGTDLVDPSRPGKVVERTFWPADRQLPDKLKGKQWQQNGTWEVRAVRNNDVTIWRDYTKAERERMGEILDARYTIGKTYMLMARDLATGRFYRDIAMNEAWAQGEQPAEGTWVDAAEYGRYWNDDTIQWVKVPSTEIPNTDGKKRYAALAGKYVRAEIWRDIQEVDQMSRPGLWERVLKQWKLNKTARSPVVHMNNVMSNLMFMDMADVSAADLISGIKAYATSSKDYQEAADNGAFGADMISAEIRKNVLEPILKELQGEALSGRSVAETKLGTLGKVAEQIWTTATGADQTMTDAYRIEDEIFRMALYMRRRRQGDTPKEAASEAREQFLDYDIRAPAINMLRRTVLPFISYTYRAVPVIARSLAAHPWKLPKYFLIAYLANAMAYMIDDDDDEDWERRSMRDQEQGYTWVGVPRMVRMPWRDQNGNPVFLDIRRWIPAGDVFDLGQGSGAIALPAPLQFGGPLMLAAELMLNRSAFTGQDIVNKRIDDFWDRTQKVGDYLWKNWMPSAAWVPGSWYWNKIDASIRGAEGAETVPQAALSSIGIKAKGQDIEKNFQWRAYEFRKIEQELRFEARRISNARARNRMSEAEFNREMQALVEKSDRLKEKAAERLKPREKPAPTKEPQQAQ